MHSTLTDKVNFAGHFSIWILMTVLVIMAFRSPNGPEASIHWYDWAIGVASATIWFSIDIAPRKRNE